MLKRLVLQSLVRMFTSLLFLCVCIFFLILLFRFLFMNGENSFNVVKVDIVDRLKELRSFRKRLRNLVCDSAYLFPYTAFEKTAFRSLSDSLNTSLNIMDDVLSQKRIKESYS